MKILALDYGEKRIGLALGDTDARVAVPYGVLVNNGRDSVLHELTVFVQKEDIGKIIVGIPFALRRIDSVNEQMKKVFDFFEDVREKFSIPVETIDERLSTREAEHRTRGTPKNARAPKDAIAAAIILQNYLERDPNPRMTSE